MTHSFVVPLVVLELIRKQEKVKEYDVSTLREVTSGAAPLGKEMIEACSNIFPQAVVSQVQDYLNIKNANSVKFQDSVHKHTHFR